VGLVRLGILPSHTIDCHTVLSELCIR
jgi:hypothetical protein